MKTGLVSVDSLVGTITKSEKNDCSRQGLNDSGRGLTINEELDSSNSRPGEAKVKSIEVMLDAHKVTSSEELRRKILNAFANGAYLDTEFDDEHGWTSCDWISSRCCSRDHRFFLLVSENFVRDINFLLKSVLHKFEPTYQKAQNLTYNWLSPTRRRKDGCPRSRVNRCPGFQNNRTEGRV